MGRNLEGTVTSVLLHNSPGRAGAELPATFACIARLAPDFAAISRVTGYLDLTHHRARGSGLQQCLVALHTSLDPLSSPVAPSPYAVHGPLAEPTTTMLAD